MTQPVPNNLYGIANGTSSTSVFITIFAERAPTSNDVNYKVQQRWVDKLLGKEYILDGFTSTGGVTQAVWLNLTNGTASGLDTLTGNSGGAITPDGSANINVVGDSTSINIAGSGHTLTANVILPSTDYEVLVGRVDRIAGVTPGTTGQVLTSQGSSALPIWTDSTSGLTLTAFGSAPNADGASLVSEALTLQPADGTHPGGISLSAQTLGSGVKTLTSPPILNGLTGVLTGNNATAVTASAITQHDVLVGGASNLITSVSPGSTAGVPLVANASGDPSFGTALIAGGGTASTSFNIHGSVISGATTTSALTALTLTNGQIVIGATGATPAAASITAGSGITVTPGANSITISSTATGFVWLAESSNFAAVANHGYLMGGVTATLPASGTTGDTISFICINGDPNILQANTDQVIIIGSGQSSSAGTATSQALGDSVTLVYYSVTGFWYNAGAAQGTWLLA